MSESRILIVDDETPARNRMQDLLDDCRGLFAHVVAGEAANGADALKFLQGHAVDIMLLDIRMPGMDGIEVARHAQKLETPPAIIFATAFEEHALKAFEVNAIDYLLKPIRKERLLAALQKTLAAKPLKEEALQQAAVKARSHLSIAERGKVLLIPLHDILFLRAEQKYITVKTAAREYLLEESLTALEHEFTDSFTRVHRSVLVAKQHINGFERIKPDEGESYWAVMLKGTDERIAVSRRLQHIVKEFSN
ncbi:MAG: Sensory transduction protein LytR [Pseudomonadota bacterium]|jgi:two-component system, LytTR family, response regulator AlgR